MFYDLISFGAAIKKIRKSLSLSQTMIRTQIGIHEDTLRKLERGNSMPNIETLDLLSYVYKQDISMLFNHFKITPDNYINDRMNVILPHLRKSNYSEIKKEADIFYNTFSDSKYSENEKLKHKMHQFYEYLCSLYNMEHSFNDESRNDITILMKSLDLNITQLKKSASNIHLDKLELRIFLLLSVIYRYKNEFDTCRILLEIALRELGNKHYNDKDYLYFHFTIVYNLMTLYHRIDEHKKLDEVYKTSLSLLETSFGIHNLSTYLIRVGINKYYVNEISFSDYVNTGLSLLSDCGYEEKAERYRKTFMNKYPFLNL